VAFDIAEKYGKDTFLAFSISAQIGCRPIYVKAWF